MSILYDYPTLENKDDETLKRIHTFIGRLSKAAVPGAYLVELFPWMMHIPERYALLSRGFSQRSTVCPQLREVEARRKEALQGTYEHVQRTPECRAQRRCAWKKN